MFKKIKIALVVSHPIQHFCPQYVSFAKNTTIEFKVFFASALGLKKYYDENFRKEISWSNLQLDQFDHIFLNGETTASADKNIDAASLDKELALFKPDIIITYGYFQKLQRRAYHWAIKNKVKLAYISDSELRQTRNKWKGLIKAVYLKRYFSRISYFLTVGNANETFYKKHGVSDAKMKRMHFPIDQAMYQKSWIDKADLRTTIRDQYALSESDIVLATVGKLVPWKNQDHIIAAMQQLENEGCIMSLLVLGSGEMREQWEKKASALKKSKVHFCGFVAIENLPAYYAATDIYVHPASVEPHSIAISEAIYMGCPVIISDRCGSYGISDDVQEGKNGFVYPFGKINELSMVIKALAGNKEKRLAFGSFAHNIAVDFQVCSHQKIIGELIKVV